MEKVVNEEIKELKEKNEALQKEISFLKKQQFDITQAKELYLKIFEEFPALIWRSGLDKLCNYFNKTWLEFTGRTMEQEMGNGWAEGVHPEDFDYCLKTYVEAFDKREAFVMEYRMKNKHGEYRWIRDFGRPFYDLDNSFAGYIGSCYDVTEIKDNELKLIDLNATKDKFFSIIAHDLRNPFQNICGLSELIHKNSEKYNQLKMEKLSNELYMSAKITYSLLENLLIWSRSQLKGITFKTERLQIRDLLNEIHLQVSSILIDKSVELNINIQEELQVFADKNMLETILRNLIINAIKFSFNNTKINLTVHRENHETIFIVEDFGVGMDEETSAKLFKIDTNPSLLGTMKEKGTGLGLILCKEFVEKHKGKIWIESEKCKGSKFYFTIPDITFNVQPN